MLALVSLPIPWRPIANRRLRRMSNTPVQPPRLLAAQLVVNLVIALLSFGLITALAAAVFEVRLPRQAVGFPITLVLTAAPLVPLGLCVAAVARTARAAATIGNVLFFVLAFCAGLWLPQQVMPDLLRTFTEATPTGAAVQALNDSMRGKSPRPSHSDRWPPTPSSSPPRRRGPSGGSSTVRNPHHHPIRRRGAGGPGGLRASATSGPGRSSCHGLPADGQDRPVPVTGCLEVRRRRVRPEGRPEASDVCRAVPRLHRPVARVRISWVGPGFRRTPARRAETSRPGSG